MLSFVLIATTIVACSIMIVVSMTSPPGKNYFQYTYWRPTNSRISKHQLHLLQQKFPVHVNNNQNEQDGLEIISHPGYLLADKEKLDAIMMDATANDNHIVLIKNMMVPKFWDPKEVFGSYSGGVREFLGNYGKYLIRPEEASAIGSYHKSKETIFVAIASYRDPECYPTVESIFTRAKFPERIRVAIVDQRKSNIVLPVQDADADGEDAKERQQQQQPEEDPTCRPPTTESCQINPEQILCKYKNNIDYMEYPAEAMVGPVFARHLAYRMYRGEYFALQIDSHVRFVLGWDEDIIDQWYATGNEMAVISNYMSDISNGIDPVTHTSRKPHRASKYCRHFESPKVTPSFVTTILIIMFSLFFSCF